MVSKMVSKELRDKFDELANREFTDEEKDIFKQSHTERVIYTAVLLTILCYFLYGVLTAI